MIDVAWTQWSDIDTPDGVTALSTAEADLTDDDLARITFYVPRYMGGRPALEWATRMPRLRVLQVPNAGYDNALEFVRPGVTLCNARGVHDESTAELAVTLALTGRRGFAELSAAAADHRWDARPFTSLTDSHIAVVGHGSIGRTIVRMLSGFMVDVDTYSRRGTDGARPVADLAARLGRYDVVILVMPLTPESEHLFDAAMLARMRDGALLVNVARGRVVDTEALLAELTAGRLRAAIDVVDPEPLPAGHPLWDAPGCLITPHVGGNTSAFAPRMRALIAAQLRRLTAGEPLANVIVDGSAAAGARP